MSKGSRPRPYSINQEDFANSFEKIFGKKEPKPAYVPPPLPEDMQGIKSSFEQQLGTNQLPPGRT